MNVVFPIEIHENWIAFRGSDFLAFYIHTIWMRTQQNHARNMVKLYCNRVVVDFCYGINKTLDWNKQQFWFCFLLLLFRLLFFRVKCLICSVYEGACCMHLICRTFESVSARTAVDAASFVSIGNCALSDLKTIWTNIFCSRSWIALMKLPSKSDYKVVHIINSWINFPYRIPWAFVRMGSLE